MSEQQQISKLAGALTEHQHHFGAMPIEDRQWVIQNTKDAITLFTQAVRNRDVVSSIMPEVFRLTVDYSQLLEHMIITGRYDWTNDDITAKRFPTVGEGTIEFEARYFHFNRNISSENAVKEIERADKDNPWVPARNEHILAFGETFPDEQRKFPIVGLGSVAKVRGHRYVLGLGRNDSDRGLYLLWWYDDWYPNCRFLAVRKVSVA